MPFCAIPATCGPAAEGGGGADAMCPLGGARVATPPPPACGGAMKNVLPAGPHSLRPGFPYTDTILTIWKEKVGEKRNDDDTGSHWKRGRRHTRYFEEAALSLSLSNLTSSSSAVAVNFYFVKWDDPNFGADFSGSSELRVSGLELITSSCCYYCRDGLVGG